MKKLLALVLCLIMVVSVFAGCGDSGNAFETQGAEETQAAQATENTLPEDITLTIGLPLNANVTDYDTNAYTLWLKEKTGYNIVFKKFQTAENDYKSQISTMLITGTKMPDILWNVKLGKSTYEEYGGTYLIDLAPYYNDREKSATFWERMSELPEEQQEYVVRQLTSDDGSMWAFPRVEYSLYDTMQYQMYVNQKWLTKLGLEMPNSPETLYDVLVAFRDRDPNGNGKKDEIPLYGGTGNYADVISWIINMFVYCNDARWFNVDENNQLYLPHTTEEYRQALIFINKLIKEGLLNSNVFSAGTKELKNQLNQPAGEVQKVGMFAGHPTIVMSVDNECVYDFEAMPYWGYAVRADQAFTAATFITTDCEYPEAAWNLLMVMCSKEGAYRLRYGEKGKDWVDADPGTVSFLGQPAELKILNESVWGNQGNSTWGVIQATILTAAENELCQLSDDMGEWVNRKMKLMADCYYNYVAAEANNPDEKYVMPALAVPDEVSDADYNERSNCQKVINQATSDFCQGTGTYTNPSDPNQWAAYLAELERQGVNTWTQNRQLVYELQFPERVK